MYNESLSYDESDEEATLQLANLYLTTNDYESCQKLCQQLMNAEGKAANDAAFTMMATIMFRKKVFFFRKGRRGVVVEIVQFSINPQPLRP